jgi:hypothetical protein
MKGPPGPWAPESKPVPPMPTPMDKAIDNDDRIWEQERHQRRMYLMGELGKIERRERRAMCLMFIACALGVLALIGSML